MLSKSRLLSALLVTLGVALFVAGLIAPRFFLGDGRMPLDLENTTYTLYDEAGQVEGETTGVTRQLHMDIQNPATKDTVSLRIGDTIFRGNDGSELGNLITAQTWSWKMDRVTGEALGPASLSTVMVMPATAVEIGGPWLKLPVNYDQDVVDFFDPILRDTAAATLSGAEDVDGRSVQSWEQRVEPTNLAREYAGINNTKTVTDEAGNATQLYLTYEADRAFRTDAITGLVVGVRESVDLYYADAQGERVEDYVTYSAATTDDEARVAQLSGVASQAASRTATIVVIVVGAVVAVVGLLGAFWPRRRSSQY